MSAEGTDVLLPDWEDTRKADGTDNKNISALPEMLQIVESSDHDHHVGTADFIANKGNDAFGNTKPSVDNKKVQFFA